MWSSVASVGAVDAAGAGKILFDGAVAQLGIGVLAASARVEARQRARALALLTPRISATIRYAVTIPNTIDGQDASLVGLQLVYRRGDGQVLATLVQVPVPILPSTPSFIEETPLNQFDSETFGGVVDDFQTRDTGYTGPGTYIIDFKNNVYYVVLTLIAPNSPFLGVPPAVAAIRLIAQGDL